MSSPPTSSSRPRNGPLAPNTVGGGVPRENTASGGLDEPSPTSGEPGRPLAHTQELAMRKRPCRRRTHIKFTKLFSSRNTQAASSSSRRACSAACPQDIPSLLRGLPPKAQLLLPPRLWMQTPKDLPSPASEHLDGAARDLFRAEGLASGLAGDLAHIFALAPSGSDPGDQDLRKDLAADAAAKEKWSNQVVRTLTTSPDKTLPRCIWLVGKAPDRERRASRRSRA
jgi:hypothetical protein